MSDYNQRKQQVQNQFNAENIHFHSSNLIHQIWDKLEPDLQDALSLAYNQALRDGLDLIKTKYFFAALARLRPEPVDDFIKNVPASAFPKPINQDITTERNLLKGNPSLSGCVDDSLRTLIVQLPKNRKLSSVDVLVDIAEYGTGSSVAKLRQNGITADRVNNIVDEFGWDVIRR